MGAKVFDNFLSFFKSKTSGPLIAPMVLIAIDGFGVAPPSSGNTISLAKKPVFDWIEANFPHGQLVASGESVGLPANQAGSSEVGHLAMGAGRVIYQSLPRINMSIGDGSFFRNQALVSAIEHTRINNSNLHIMGLSSTGNVHASLLHLNALMELCARNKLSKVRFHLFADGRDAPRGEAKEVFGHVDEKIKKLKIGTIATIAGRYYAMDRDARWERTQKTYEAMVAGMGPRYLSIDEAINAASGRKETDEFILPSIIDSSDLPFVPISDGDAVIFFNFRVDRPRQLTMSFVMPNFEMLKSFEFGLLEDHGKEKKESRSGPTFKRSKILKNLFFVTMTEYQKNIPVSAIAFPQTSVEQSLSQIIAQRGMRQMHIAESEKERMVTFYMDGLREARFEHEDVVIVPSPRVTTYDRVPEMALFDIVDKFKKALDRNTYHFFVINFANPDMVAHSGNLTATVRAIEYVDQAVGEVVRRTLERGGRVVITADHGNAEELLTFPSSSFFFTSGEGKPNTEHSINPVPIYLISPELRGQSKVLAQGSLADVAPTILDMMNIDKPALMTGVSLFKK